MKIPSEIIKSVAFIGTFDAELKRFEPFGSAMILGQLIEGRYCEPVFFVTAKHTLDNLSAQGTRDLFIRVNLSQGGTACVPTVIEEWFTHPTDSSIDVAIYELGISADLEHAVFPLQLTYYILSQQEFDVSPGDEVFITGFFSYHHVVDRNVPIVRTGNLACAEELSVRSKGEDRKLYLIEARSTGGLSGSPVYLNLGHHRIGATGLIQEMKHPYWFLGIVHGHFQTRAEKKASDKNEPASEWDRVNVGIAMVTPAIQVHEVIQQYRATGQQKKRIIGKTADGNFEIVATP